MKQPEAKKAGVTTWWEDIDADKAREYLKHNTRNRPVNADRVRKYAADMRGGRWTVTHQGIGFSADGTLVDGQHRLLAIIDANVTVHTAVTMGLTAECQLAIDTGARRTTAQNLGLRGRVGAKHVVAWSNAVVNVITGASRFNLSEPDALRVYEELPEAVALGLAHVNSVFARGPVGGALLFAYNRSPEKARTFVEGFREGTGLIAGSPILAATKFYLQGPASASDDRRATALKFLRCLQAHVEGSTLNPAHVYAGEGVVDFFGSSHKPGTVFGDFMVKRRERKGGE